MNRYRLIYLGLGLLLVVVVALGVAFGSPDTPGDDRPAQIEAVSPEPGETVLRQARLEVDVPAGYTVEIFVDGFRVPEEELFIVEGTGVHSWQPGSETGVAEWSPGQHEVLVRWRTLSGLPDVGEYSWSFRVY